MNVKEGEFFAFIASTVGEKIWRKWDDSPSPKEYISINEED